MHFNSTMNFIMFKSIIYIIYLLMQYVEDNLGVMSVGFLLASPDDAVIWRGPKKNGLLVLSVN